MSYSTQATTSTHIHQLTPYPHDEMTGLDAFPFPPVKASPSRQTLQYPRRHMQSRSTAHFALSSTKDSPIPPTLLSRRTSSCSTRSSTSTQSFGNWTATTPPALTSSFTRRGSVASTASSSRLQTPEMGYLDSFSYSDPEFDAEEEEAFGMVPPVQAPLGKALSRRRLSSAKPILWHQSHQASKSTDDLPLSLPELGSPVLPVQQSQSTRRPALSRKLTPHPATNQSLSPSRTHMRPATQPTLSESAEEET